jgi:thiol-disulfide isomerase/thioredoxin
MRKILFCLFAATALLLPSHRLAAADTNAVAAVASGPSNAAASDDLKALITRVQAGIDAGKRTEAEQADNLKQFDVLLAKYKGDKSDDVARILYMKAMLYLQVFNNSAKGTELVKQIQTDYPDTIFGKQAEKLLANIAQVAASEKIQSTLVENAAFPDFDVKDLDGKPLSVSSYKGKVVMVDFWATWCPPCRAEVPNVVAAYEKYHDKGFEIIGVSLDHAEDKDKLLAYMKENKMPWRQYFDGKFWSNDLAVKYGIQSIPQSFLLDRSGKILAKGDDLRGEKLAPAIAKALGIN